MPYVLGPGESGGGGLRGLVGVERPLVVGVGARVQLLAGEVDVEVLQLHAERGHVLLGELLHRGDLGLDARELTPLARLAGRDGDGDEAADDDQQEQEFHGHMVRSGGKVARPPGP